VLPHQPVSACVAAYRFAVAAALWLGRIFTKQNNGQAEPAKAGSAKPKKSDAAKPVAGETGAGEENDALERERQEQQEKDLQAFRAKLKDPIKITTMTMQPKGDDNGADEPLSEGELDSGEAGRRSKTPRLSQKAVGQQKPYILPKADILSSPPEQSLEADEKAITENSAILEKTLLSFDIEGKVCNVCYGPVVTRYEIELAPGVKVSKVINLQNDIAMAVGGQKIRIEAPIPGKAAIALSCPTETSRSCTSSTSSFPTRLPRQRQNCP